MIVKSAPDVLVHLHQADVAGGGFEPSDAIADHHELPPAAFLPRGGEHERDVSAAVVSVESVQACIDLAELVSGAEIEQQAHVVAIGVGIFVVDDEAVEAVGDILQTR